MKGMKLHKEGRTNNKTIWSQVKLPTQLWYKSQPGQKLGQK